MIVKMGGRGPRWGRLLTLFLFVWLCCLVYFLANLMGGRAGDDVGLAGELEASKIQVDTLRRENFELRDLLKSLQSRLTEREGGDNDDVLAPPAAPEKPPSSAQLSSSAVSKYVEGPSLAYEQTRRVLRRDVNELWWFLKDRLQTVAASDAGKDVKADIEALLENAAHREKVVVADIDKLAQEDGYEGWRRKVSIILKQCLKWRTTLLHSLPQAVVFYFPFSVVLVSYVIM